MGDILRIYFHTINEADPMPNYKDIKGRPALPGFMERTMSASRSLPSSPILKKRNNPSPVPSPLSSVPKNTFFTERVEENYKIKNTETKHASKSPEYNESSNNSNEADHIDADKADDSVQSYENKSSMIGNQQNYQYWYFGLVLIVIFAVFIPILYNLYKGNYSYKNDLLNMRNKFPSQDIDTWSIITSGLQNVIDSDGKNTAFLLINFGNQDMTVNKLSNEIATIAARGLGTANPIVLSEKDILSLPDEVGYFIDKYEKDLQEKKVLLIPNLHKIPSVVAQSFHFICDSENPLVKKSIIIFTMDMPKVLPVPGSLLKATESTLKKLWSPPLNDNIISPLIVRLTSSIVPVISESMYYK